MILVKDIKWNSGTELDSYIFIYKERLPNTNVQNRFRLLYIKTTVFVENALLGTTIFYGVRLIDNMSRFNLNLKKLSLKISLDPCSCFCL